MDKLDKIYVINLDHRTDRYELIQKELKKHDLTNHQRFSAIKKDRNESNGRLKGGVWGCLLSHLEIIKLAKKNNYKAILILEDDVYFSENIRERVNQALYEIEDKEIEMFYLGSNHMVSPVPVSENTVLIRKSFTTHAYIIFKNIFDKCIEELPNSNVPIDVYYCDHIHTRGNSYALKPMVAYQRPGYSDIEYKNVEYKLR